MAASEKKKCCNCKRLFRPDPRNAKRQKYCSQPDCRKASKASSQQRWLQKEENRDYFRGPDNVQRVQQWRKANPGYWRRERKNKPHALQDRLTQQGIENNNNPAGLGCHTLQDSLIWQPTVLIGLIAQLTGYVLQDDIAMAARRMQQLGIDILNPHQKGERHGTQTAPLS
jgi:hypothetical protein